MSSAELGTEYADQPIDLPNETETVGDVFDRLDSAVETREALYGELTEEVAGNEEYDLEGPIEGLAGRDVDWV